MKFFASTICGLVILLVSVVECFADGTGTGFIIRKDGYIITNHHVIDGAREIWVAVPGKTAELRATVKLDDSLHDLALIKIEGQKRDRQEIVARASRATVLIKILSAENVAMAPTPAPTRPQPDSTQPQLATVDFLTSIDSILRAHDYETLSRYLGEKTYYFGKVNATKAWIRNDMINDQRTYAWCKTAPDLSTYKEWVDANGYLHQAVDEETWAQERAGRLHHAHCRLGIVWYGSTILEFHFDVLRGHTERGGE